MAKPEDPRFAHLRPQKMVVINAMDPDHMFKTEAQITFLQTLGHMREDIANREGLEVNEFSIFFRDQRLDPMGCDHLKYQDLQKVDKFMIRRNEFYNPSHHPKYAVAKNQDYFETLFKKLRAS